MSKPYDPRNPDGQSGQVPSGQQSPPGQGRHLGPPQQGYQRYGHQQNAAKVDVMTGPAYQPPQYQGPWQPPPPPPQPRHRALIIALVVVAIVATLGAVAALGVLFPGHSIVSALTPKPSVSDTPSPTPSPTVTTVTATFSLVDQDTADNACEGQGGYSDIDTGSSITIEDQKDETIGSTTLDKGTADADTCTWELSFDEVPMDHTQYTLKIGSRGGLTYNRHYMETNDWHFDAEIG